MVRYIQYIRYAVTLAVAKLKSSGRERNAGEQHSSPCRKKLGENLGVGDGVGAGYGAESVGLGTKTIETLRQFGPINSARLRDAV